MNTSMTRSRLPGALVGVGIINFLVGLGLALLCVYVLIMSGAAQRAIDESLAEFKRDASGTIVHPDAKLQETLRALDINSHAPAFTTPTVIAIIIGGVLLAAASLALLRRKPWGRFVSLGVHWVGFAAAAALITSVCMQADWSLTTTRLQLLQQVFTLLPTAMYAILAMIVLHSRACREAMIESPRTETSPALA